MTYIAEALRQQVIRRAGERCEYCPVHQDDSLYAHEVDHIIPVKHRGETNAENLCLVCLECDGTKAAILVLSIPTRTRSRHYSIPASISGAIIFGWKVRVSSRFPPKDVSRCLC